MMTLSKFPERLAVPGCKLVAGQQRARALSTPFKSHVSTTQNTPKIGKADELPVHNRKGLGNQKAKGGRGVS